MGRMLGQGVLDMSTDLIAKMLIKNIKRGLYTHLEEKPIDIKPVRQFMLTHPNGRQEVITDIKQAALKYKIMVSGLTNMVSDPRRSQHKGWKCKEIFR